MIKNNNQQINILKKSINNQGIVATNNSLIKFSFKI